jgi:hypothetical protein
MPQKTFLLLNQENEKCKSKPENPQKMKQALNSKAHLLKNISFKFWLSPPPSSKLRNTIAASSLSFKSFWGKLQVLLSSTNFWGHLRSKNEIISPLS